MPMDRVPMGKSGGQIFIANPIRVQNRESAEAVKALIEFGYFTRTRAFYPRNRGVAFG
jgi:hypothetical protein